MKPKDLEDFTKEQLEAIVKFKDTEVYIILKKIFDDWYEDAKKSSFNETLIGVDSVVLSQAQGFRRGKLDTWRYILEMPDRIKNNLLNNLLDKKIKQE